MSPLILSIETATPGGSVAVSRGKELIACLAGNSGLSHSNTLLIDIDKVLSDADISLTQVDVFAVAIGPGSFTGLRIGIATVKGLASTLGRQCAGVPTLHAIAHAVGRSRTTIALLPAGRGEVFVQALSVNTDGVVTELDDAVHIPPQRMLERYSAVRNAWWAGVGAELYADSIRSFFKGGNNEPLVADVNGDGWKLASPISNLASHVGALAALKAASYFLEAPDELQALYVRPSDAELNPKFSVSNK